MEQNKVLVIILTIISISAIISYLASPVFNLHNVVFNDLKYVTRSEIDNKLSRYLNKNIWLIVKTNVAKQLNSYKYIKSIDVKKKLPDTLELNIVERVPVAKINNNGKYTVFTVNGYILEEGAMKTRYPVPLIIGTGYSFSGLKLNFPTETEKIIQALKNIDEKTRTNIKEIVINNNKLTLEMSDDSQAKVYMGELEEIKRKFDTFSSIYTKISNENIKINYIDLKVVDKPVIGR